MKEGLIADKISTLPKWAQAHIRNLDRERTTAVDALNAYCDGQSKSEIFIDDLKSTGENSGPSIKRRYIQSHNVSVIHDGILLRVRIDKSRISLQWSDEQLGGSRTVAFIPTSFMAADLIRVQASKDQ